MRALIDIKQIDVSRLNDVKIYDELPLEVEGQVAHVVIVLLLGATMLNAYIPPKVFSLLNLLSLAFPFLMIANLLPVLS